MNELSRYGWVMPVEVNAPNRPQVPAALLMAFWIATLAYNLANGLMYGTRSAIFMDVPNPAVAATQFTAYMAMLNLTISYSAVWQGIAAEAWGYPRTMLVDALFGLVGLAALPFMKRIATAGEGRWTDAGAAKRARGMALVLGLACLAWLPYSWAHDRFGAAQAIFGTLFTLVFVASALFLLASAAVLAGSARGLARAAIWVAPLLLAMYVRYHLDSIASLLHVDAAAFRSGMGLVMDLVALAGGALLVLLSRKPWVEMGAPGVQPDAAGAAAAA